MNKNKRFINSWDPLGLNYKSLADGQGCWSKKKKRKNETSAAAVNSRKRTNKMVAESDKTKDCSVFFCFSFQNFFLTRFLRRRRQNKLPFTFSTLNVGKPDNFFMADEDFPRCHSKILKMVSFPAIIFHFFTFFYHYLCCRLALYLKAADRLRLSLSFQQIQIFKLNNINGLMSSPMSCLTFVTWILRFKLCIIFLCNIWSPSNIFSFCNYTAFDITSFFQLVNFISCSSSSHYNNITLYYLIFTLTFHVIIHVCNINLCSKSNNFATRDLWNWNFYKFSQDVVNITFSFVRSKQFSDV